MPSIHLGLRRSVFSLVVALLLCPGLSKAQAADVAGHVYILLVIDTHAKKIGENMAVNRDRLRQVIDQVRDSQSPWFQDRISLDIAEDDQVTPQFIRDYYRTLSSHDDDTLVFYYCGHGATDRQHGHYLAMSGGSILRSEILDLMRKKSPRLAVLLTDCCSSYSSFARMELPPPRQSANWKLFFQLFFRSTGFVDIQAASEGEFGWSNKQIGGFFTHSLTNLLCKPIDDLDYNEDGFVSWNEFFFRLRRDTLDVFAQAKKNARPREDGAADIRDAAAQTPWAFWLGRWPAEYRRYLRVVNETGEPLRVWVQYYTLDEGEWRWFYPTSHGRYYELAPGEAIYLRDDDTGWVIDAYKARIWAVSTRSDKEWESRNIVLTPEHYHGSMNTYTYTFYP